MTMLLGKKIMDEMKQTHHTLCVLTLGRLRLRERLQAHQEDLPHIQNHQIRSLQHRRTNIKQSPSIKVTITTTPN